MSEAIVPLRVIRDGRGALLPMEAWQDVPFSIWRAYYLFDSTEGSSRGYHAHRILEQVLVCLTGRCRVILDDGRTRVEHTLDSPSHGVYIGPMVWRELHDMTPGTVIAVLASQPYDESDYIRSYGEFLDEAAR